MENTISKALELLLPGSEVSASGPFPCITIAPSELHSNLEILKNSEQTRLDFLFCLTGVDYPDSIELVYHLRSTSLGHALVVKCRTMGRELPKVETVSDLWPTAEFHEREIFDLLGVHFDKHPDLRRIFLDEGWPGFPLRKDYTDPYNIVER